MLKTLLAVLLTMSAVAMDVPGAVILLEARVLPLQIAIAVVAGCALYPGRREGRAYRAVDRAA